MDWVMCVSARVYETMRGSWDLDVSRIETAPLMSNPQNKRLALQKMMGEDYIRGFLRAVEQRHEEKKEKSIFFLRRFLFPLTVGCFFPIR